MNHEKEEKAITENEDSHYQTIKKISDICFEYLTKITLVGVLHQLSSKIENTTIAIAAATFKIILITNIAFAIFRITDQIADMISRKTKIKLWQKIALTTMLVSPIIYGYNFHISPAIIEVITYYSESDGDK